MIGWAPVFAASLVCLAAKLLGYALPRGWLERPRVERIAALAVVALLSALIVVQTLGSGQSLSIDARVPALAAAALALWFRAPFIVVVLVAASVAAGLRAVV